MAVSRRNGGHASEERHPRATPLPPPLTLALPKKTTPNKLRISKAVQPKFLRLGIQAKIMDLKLAIKVGGRTKSKLANREGENGGKIQ